MADNVVSLNNDGFTLSSTINNMVSEANSDNSGEGIVIDGYFGDWNDVNKQFDSISNAESEHISLEQYAAIEDNEKYWIIVIVENIEKQIASLNKSYQNIVANLKLKE